MANTTNTTEYYNKELKERFLKEKYNNFKNISILFRRIAPYEQEFGKDVCNWTAFEIVDFYKCSNVVSLDTLINMNSILMQYTNFCLDNNLVIDNQNHFSECTHDVLNSCRNKSIADRKIVDRKTVLNWVNELPNERDKFVLLSLFEFGKSKDFYDIVHARQEDVDHEHCELKLSNRTVKISRELLNIIDRCAEENDYHSISNSGKKIMQLVDYGYILKSYPNQNDNVSDFQKGRNVYQCCRRIFSYLGAGDYMSPNAISESGKLHMIEEKANEYGISPVELLFDDRIKEVEYQFDTKIVRSKDKRKYSEFFKA